MVSHPLEQRSEMPQHPLNDVVRKASPRVLDLQLQLLVTIGYDRQRIVGLAQVPEATLAPRVSPVARSCASSDWFSNTRMLSKSGLPRGTSLQPWTLTSGVCSNSRSATCCARSRAQPRHKFELGINIHPHGQRIDEQAKHVIGAAEGRFAAGAGGAEHNVRLPAVTVQQQGPGSLQQRIERYGRLTRSHLQGGGKRNRQTNLMGSAIGSRTRAQYRARGRRPAA